MPITGRQKMREEEKKQDTKKEFKEDIVEHIKRNWAYWLGGLILSTIGLTWAVCIEIRVEPLKDTVESQKIENVRLKKQSEEYKENIKELEGQLSETKQLLEDTKNLLAKNQETSRSTSPTKANLIILEPTWISGGETTTILSGQVAVRYDDQYYPDAIFYIQKRGEKDPSGLQFYRTGSKIFEYEGVTYLFHLHSLSEGTHNAKISIAKKLSK